MVDQTARAVEALQIGSLAEVLSALLRPTELPAMQQRVRRAYRAYARGHHPDIVGRDDPNARALFGEVTRVARAIMQLRGTGTDAPNEGEKPEPVGVSIGLFSGRRR